MTEVIVDFGERDKLRPDLAGWRRDVVSERPTGTTTHIVPQWICEIVSPGHSILI